MNEFLEAAKERLEEFELQFAFSVLSSRVFMRIHNRMMDYAFDQLIAIIEKNSHGRPEPDKNVARRTVIRTVDVCVKKERLPKGSINK